MKKNFQMIIFVSVSFAFILILWFQFFVKNISKNNNPNQEIENIKNSIKDVMGEASTLKKISDNPDIKEIQKIMEQKINGTEPTNIQSEITEKVEQKINEDLSTKNNTVEYQYEPWGIKFSYPSDMIKTVDQKLEKIEIVNKDDNKIIITISKINKKLSKIINTSKYTKTTYNNLEFFENSEQKINTIYRKDYYTEIDSYSYTFKIECPYEKISDYWEILNLIPKSFGKL